MLSSWNQTSFSCCHFVWHLLFGAIHHFPKRVDTRSWALPIPADLEGSAGCLNSMCRGKWSQIPSTWGIRQTYCIRTRMWPGQVSLWHWHLAFTLCFSISYWSSSLHNPANDCDSPCDYKFHCYSSIGAPVPLELPALWLQTLWSLCLRMERLSWSLSTNAGRCSLRWHVLWKAAVNAKKRPRHEIAWYWRTLSFRCWVKNVSWIPSQISRFPHFCWKFLLESTVKVGTSLSFIIWLL